MLFRMTCRQWISKRRKLSQDLQQELPLSAKASMYTLTIPIDWRTLCGRLATMGRPLAICIHNKIGEWSVAPNIAIGGPLKIFLWQENATPGPHCMYHANIWPSMTSSLTIKREISNFHGPRLYSPKHIKWTKTQLTFLVWNYYSIVLVSRHRGLLHTIH